MGDKHRDIQEIVVQMLDWYGFVGDSEVGIEGGFLDCAAFRRGETSPFMGIEVHLKGSLDTDLKKLLSNEYLSHKVILTPDRSLISSMSQSMPNIKWFLFPDKSEIGFENYLREVSNAGPSKKYWFTIYATVQNMIDSPEPVKNFEKLLKENGLDADIAEEIIFRGALPGGEGYLGIAKFKDTNEYAFLCSLGIVAALEIYWYDMEWDGNIRCSYEKVEMPDGSSTRQLKGEPLLYMKNKDIITGVIRKYVQSRLELLKDSLKDYNDIFNEIALIGSQGHISKPSGYPSFSDFMSKYEISNLSGALPTETKRLGALAANPRMRELLWHYAQKLLNIGLGMQTSQDLIRIPYKLLSDMGGYTGTISKHSDEADEYLSWWALLNAGIRNKSVREISGGLGIPWETVNECVELTFSNGLSSRFIPDSNGIRGMRNFMGSRGVLGGVNDFSIFKPQEFSDFCYQKMIEAFTTLVGLKK